MTITDRPTDAVENDRRWDAVVARDASEDETFHAARLVGDDPAFDALVARVVALVENPSLGDGLPLDGRGTAFQERVWRALREVTVGGERPMTTTYSSTVLEYPVDEAWQLVRDFNSYPIDGVTENCSVTSSASGWVPSSAPWTPGR